jgi:hypothetical protein
MMGKRSAIGFVMGHLALVICGAAGIRLSQGYTAPLAVYGAASGADNSYGFFAPGVAPMPRVVVSRTDRSGACCQEVVPCSPNREVNLRLGTGVSMFLYVDQQTQRELASGWAAAAFAQDPQAERVVVRVELHEVPKMAEYRAGQRPRWVRYYEGEFVRGDRVLAEGGVR